VSFANLRLGVVPYLNVLPLLEGLGETIPQENWIRATPRELAGLMAARELDISILPIFEALRTPGYRILPGCAIACDGPVRSVKLFSLKPLDEIRSVVLDRSSLTSVHLAQVLLRDRLAPGAQPFLSQHPILPTDQVAHLDADAAVVIGDTALAWGGTYPLELDLGEEWKRQKGLPFVFAAWVARPGVQLSRALLEAFVAARGKGERDVYEIARRVAGEDEARLRDVVEYLSKSIVYRLGPEARKGIEQFAAELRKQGFLPNSKTSLEFIELEDCPTAAGKPRN